MKTAKLISTDEKSMLCECVECHEEMKRSIKHQGVPTTCKHCGTDQFNPKYIKGVINDDLEWLTSCPASDMNFKLTLKDSSIETMIEALKNPKITSTARLMIESSIAKKIKPKKKPRKKGLITVKYSHYDCDQGPRDNPTELKGDRYISVGFEGHNIGSAHPRDSEEDAIEQVKTLIEGNKEDHKIKIEDLRADGGDSMTKLWENEW